MLSSAELGVPGGFQGFQLPSMFLRGIAQRLTSRALSGVRSRAAGHTFCLFGTWHLPSIRKLYRHRPQIALQEKLDTMARAGDKLGRHPTQSRGKDEKGKQDTYNSICVKGRQEKDKAAAAAKSEIRNRDKLGKQGGSGSQERS